MSRDTPGEGPLTYRDFASMPVDTLKGVGSRKLSGLSDAGIDSLLDVLTHYPRRYVDRSREVRIAELAEGEEALVIARVTGVSARRTRNRRTMVTADLEDRSGRLRCTFFNQPWRERQLDPEVLRGEVAVFGKVELYRGTRQMTNPVVDLVGDRTGRIVAIYPQSAKAGLSSWDLSSWVAQVLRRSEKARSAPSGMDGSRKAHRPKPLAVLLASAPPANSGPMTSSTTFCASPSTPVGE